MAFLKPDNTRTEQGLVINEKIIPAGSIAKAGRLLSGGTGKPEYVTVHNTGAITAAGGTSMAEQYTRATLGGNMNDVRVHYYIDHEDCWQMLAENEVGWHAADGRGPGNETSLALEVIMRGDGSGLDQKAEVRAALLAAILLHRHGLSIDRLTTHNHWMGLPDAIVQGKPKNCPLYILPHWGAFVEQVRERREALQGEAVVIAPETPARPAAEDEYSRVQVGAFKSLDNATALKAKLQAAGYSVYMVYTGGLYKLQVGAFTDSAQAVAMRDVLAATGYDAFVTGAAADSIKETTARIGVGSVVRVNMGARDYTGGGLASHVYTTDYTVLELSGDRAVIGIGKAVTAAVNIADLTLASAFETGDAGADGQSEQVGAAGNAGDASPMLFAADNNVKVQYGVYGPASGRSHWGIDVSTTGDPTVHSTVSGKVRWARSVAQGAAGWGSTWEWGYFVWIDAEDGTSHIFAHCKAGSLKVKKGDRVRAGQAIATMGMTGNAAYDSQGEHVHYEVRRGGGATDPTPWCGIPNKVGSTVNPRARG